MDEVTKVKTQFRTKQWVELIKECQSSGLPVKTWCQQNNITEQSYYYRLKKMREAACEEYLPAAQADCRLLVKFAKLQGNNQKPVRQASVLIHLSASTVEVQEGASLQTIEAVLKALQNIC